MNNFHNQAPFVPPINIPAKTQQARFDTPSNLRSEDLSRQMPSSNWALTNMKGKVENQLLIDWINSFNDSFCVLVS